MTLSGRLSGEAGRVLVVEDDAALRQTVVETCLGAGYEVEAVGDGAAAEQRLRAAAFNVVLLDIGLPFIDGWQSVEAHQLGVCLGELPRERLGAEERLAADRCQRPDNPRGAKKTSRSMTSCRLAMVKVWSGSMKK